ncbi:MAG: YjhG/YagF family D-xylonate dehydratase [Chloroflexota bacterium]|nr:YjhG/YagF family D-xylonate dehydratase [Chloroflexota bacterium]
MTHSSNDRRTPHPSPVPIDSFDSDLYEVHTHAAGPAGELPLDPDFLLNSPSGDVFGLSQNVGMGWAPRHVRGKAYLILSTKGGLRAPDGSPIALGYHTGHWEVELLVQAAAEALKEQGTVPFAGFVTDPCDGRTQGTLGMMDSLPYRNDAALVLRRLIRSLPTRRGVMGVATCDKGLPAMMMALAAQHDLPVIIVPGGVTLPPTHGEDAGAIQTVGVRFAHGAISLQEAAELGCRACATPGGGCQFLGTAATSQVVSEALGLSLLHSALAPSGQPIWLDMARRSASALMHLDQQGITASDILTEDALHNAMVVHAAFGGSTNLLLHIPAIAHAAGLPRPDVDDWTRINRLVPRLVDVLPNGPANYVTVQVFLAGGVPEVMLHLRDAGLLRLDALTVHGHPLGEMLEQWEQSERRRRLRERLKEADGVDPDDVIMDPQTAHERGLTSTISLLKGNLAPEGAIVKSTSIDPSVIDPDDVYRKVGPARIFTTERAAIAAIKGQSDRQLHPGDILILIGRGPLGSGMEETYQVTSALKALPWGKEVTLITDARFSGVSTGACIGHVGPEALAGGPIGRLREGDTVQVIVDRVQLEGRIDLVGHDGQRYTPQEGAAILAARAPHPDLAPDGHLPDDTRLWAALQSASGGTWGGCVYDVDAIVTLLEAGRKALEQESL